MPTFKAVIIENNPKDAALFKKTLKEHPPHINVVAEAYTGAIAKELFLNNQPLSIVRHFSRFLNKKV